MTAKRGERKQQILQQLAKMLEDNPCERITTAKLAAEVGVSEAALYRHFPSKTKMFEGLIEFIEETVFGIVGQIVKSDYTAIEQCKRILTLLLQFVEKNPGFSRLLTGEALTGETERLHHRIAQFFARLETQLRQILREAEVREGIRPVLPVNSAVCLLTACAEGRIAQYSRSNFKQSPTDEWSEQWDVLTHGFFRKTMSANA